MTEGYYLGKFEVTQAQYQAVMATNPSHWQGYENRPVEMVSQQDAIDFCELLTQKEREAGTLQDGWKYTLPTEAEWEYGRRAGTTTRFHWGIPRPLLMVIISLRDRIVRMMWDSTLPILGVFMICWAMFGNGPWVIYPPTQVVQ